MASVDPKLIENIRIRKQAQELIKKSAEHRALRERLIELSGIKERGINPDELVINDEYLGTLLNTVEQALKSGTLFPENTEAEKSEKNAIPTRRQHI
jgi:hypothetical protein